MNYNLYQKLSDIVQIKIIHTLQESVLYKLIIHTLQELKCIWYKLIIFHTLQIAGKCIVQINNSCTYELFKDDPPHIYKTAGV